MAALGTAAGCSTTSMRVIRYPDFYGPDLRTVIVLPFDNETLSPEAGRFVAHRIAAVLAATGAYQVVDQTLPPPAPPTTTQPATGASTQPVPAQPQPAVEPGKAAYLVGTVKVFAAASYPYMVWMDRGYTYPHYGYRSHWHGMYWDGPYYGPSGYWPADVYMDNQATVAVVARLVRATDGAVLWQAPTEIRAAVLSRGDPPVAAPEECLARAADEVGRRLAAQVVPSQVEVRVKADVNFRSARALAPGQWEYTDSFGPGDADIHLVVTLPPDCDRNQFRVEVRPAGSTRTLFKAEFAWSRRNPQLDLTLDAGKLLQAGAGRKFVATFFHDTRAVMRRSFRVRSVR